MIAIIVLGCVIGIAVFFNLPKQESIDILISGAGVDRDVSGTQFPSSMRRFQSSKRNEKIHIGNDISSFQQLYGVSSEYSAPAGFSYSPSTSAGISSNDQSPEIPAKFLKEEEIAEHGMVRLRNMLKKSKAQQSDLVQRIKALHDFIAGEVTSIKDVVRHTNTKLTDDISSLSRDVVGPAGPPGLPGYLNKCHSVADLFDKKIGRVTGIRWSTRSKWLSRHSRSQVI